MSVTSVGQIGLDLVVNQKQFNSQMSGIQSLAKKTGKILASAFAVKKLVDFGKQCIELGSDLQEVQNVVDVTFPKMSAEVDKFSKSAAASFGLSETMAKKFTGTFGSMAKAFGFSEEQAYAMGTTLTGLAGDVASFYNISQDEAYTKLKSVFSGETETLKDLGVVMTQTALDSYALANGFGKTTKNMSEAEKVALRYAFVQDRLSAAVGDFSRTSDGWANQTRILKLQFDSLKASIGQGLINLFTPVIKVINTIIGKLAELAAGFSKFTEILTGKKSQNTQLSTATMEADALTDSVAGVGEAAKKSAKEMKGLAGFDELNNLSSSSSSSAGQSSAGGLDISSGISPGNAEQSTNSVIGSLDSLNKAFSKHAESFKKTLVKMKNDFVDFGKQIGTSTANWFVNLNWEPLIGSFDKLLKAIEPFTDTILDSLGFAYEDVLLPLGKWAIEDAAPESVNTLAKSFEFLNSVLSPVEEGLEKIWVKLQQPLIWIEEKAVENIGLLGDAFSSLTSTFEEKGPEITKIIEDVGYIIEALWTIAEPILTLIVGKFELSFLQIVNVASFLIKTVIDYAEFFVSSIRIKIETVEKIIKDIVNIIASIAKGDWKSAWKSFEQIFVDIWSGIKRQFKNQINLVIGIFNNLLSGLTQGVNNLGRILNKLSFDVPDWVTDLTGMKKFGFNIPTLKAPQIPRLAEGGYVRANTPQLAMIGDNRHQGEVVSPEDKLEQMALKAAQMASKNSDTAALQQMILLLKQQNELLMQILAKETGITEKELFDSVRKSAELYEGRTGKTAFSY